MSGILSQVGFANETVVPPVTTVGTSTAATIGGYPFVNLVTHGSSHGLPVGSVVVLSGYTPGAWNGTWVITAVPSVTTWNFLSTTALGPVTVHGTISASNYGSTIAGSTITPAPSRFVTYIKESMKLDAGRIESVGIGANRRVQSSTRGVVDRRGAPGTLSFEVESKGFGFWLNKIIGPVVTTGPTDSAFTHVASVSTGGPPGLLGNSFNWQGTVVGPAGPATELVKTYIGCKVTKATFNFAVGQLLTVDIDIDAMDENYTITKATASYPVNPELFSFAGATIQFAGTTWDVVKSGKISIDLGLSADRRFARANTLQKEPAEASMRVIMVDLDGEFDNVLTAYNKYATSVYSQTIAQVNVAFVGKILIGVSTFPSITFNIPVGRFDGDTPTTDGPVLPTQHVSAKALWDGTNSPINCTYVTTDATP